MERWRGIDEIPPSWGRCALTIGVFDGVHRGHQSLIGEAARIGREHGLPTVVMTFDPHPAEVVRPGSHPAMLVTLRRRAELIAELGVDALLVLPFTVALSQVSAEEFVHDILVDRLHVAHVVVGENFRFGHKGAGSVALLRELGPRFGFTVHGVTMVSGPEEVTVSSTYVRACVGAGDVAAAANALGRPHRVDGFVVHGDGRGGSQLGYPTANLDVAEHAAIPADGIYAGWFVLGNRRSPLAISIGTNPTFSGRERTVEGFVIDDGGNFYGRRVAFDFVQRLRDTVRFDSVPELIAQIDADVERTKQVLGWDRP